MNGIVQTQRKYRVHSECGKEVKSKWGMRGWYDCEHCKALVHVSFTREKVEEIV